MFTKKTLPMEEGVEFPVDIRERISGTLGEEADVVGVVEESVGPSNMYSREGMRKPGSLRHMRSANC